MSLKTNEAQEKAINCINGPVLLISCPGSGKTTTLVRRIHHMLESGIPANEILMVTFSKAAAIEMRQKYVRFYGTNPGISFQTIHALCLNLLSREGRYTRDDILPEQDKFDFLFEQVRELGDRAGDAWSLTTEIATEIGVIKNNYIQMKGYMPKSCDKMDFLSIYKSYERWKERSRRIDFDDMLIKCKEMLDTDESVRQKWADHFKYIQCDEYQDTNYIQRDILYLLSKPLNNLCVVGDDDQSIYRFRGARPEIMQSFSKDFKDATVIRMGINYRSADEIVRHSGQLIKKNKVRYEKEFVSQRGIDGTAGSVEYIRTNGKTEQTDTLIGKIKQENNEGVSWNNMAVLFRTNHEIVPFITAFSREEIPFYAIDTITCIYDGWIFRDIRNYIELSAGIWKDEKDCRRKIHAVLNRPNRYFDVRMFDKIEYTISSFRDAVYPLAKEQGWKYNDALKKVDVWMDTFGPGKITLDSSPAILGKALSGAKSLHYDRYLSETARFRNIDPEEYTSELEELLSEAEHFQTIGEWLQNADKISRQVRDENKKNDENGVVLATMHKSKGLEWHTVYIENCYDGMIPYRESTSPDEIEEERRLFYVAMTRAKDHLVVMNPKREDSPFIREANLMTEAEKKRKKAIPKYPPGKPVVHKGFGEGKIVSYGDSFVFVKFKSGTKRLKFPDAFLDGHIKYT